jgi:PEP-CTERM motif
VIIAGQPGSVGTLTLNAGSVVNAGYVGVGQSQAGPGGTAQLILNNSTINTTTFEIGALGVLSGDGGIINATGNVINYGTISPGNSPGRININCNFISMPGSKLILDVLGSGGGFAVDHVIFGNDATFNLSNLQIVFNFLGNTDPTAFAASGGFDLDNFLESQDLSTGVITGLSTVFGPDQTWASVINAGRVSAVSSVYDLSNFQLSIDGSTGAIAGPVPEPSTWVMMALGLLALGVMARRQRRARVPMNSTGSTCS